MSAAVLSLCAGPLWAADLEVIVDRHKDAVEVFVSLEAAAIPAVFGTSSDFIARPGEVVEYEALREGTWDQGDTMLAGAQLRVGQQQVALEAMSLMVHPESTPMPFDDVTDAYVAMSVCNGFEPGIVPTVDILDVYAGYIAYPSDTGDTLSFALGNQAAVEVRVRDMRADGGSVEQVLLVEPGGTFDLTLPEAPAGWPLWAYFAGLSALSALVLAGTAVFRTKENRATA